MTQSLLAAKSTLSGHCCHESNMVAYRGPTIFFGYFEKKYFKVVTSAKKFWDCKYVVGEWKSTTSVIIFFSLALIILVFCDFCENLRDTIFRTWQKNLILFRAMFMYMLLYANFLLVHCSGALAPLLLC